MYMYIVRVYVCLVFSLAGCGSCAHPGAGGSWGRRFLAHPIIPVAIICVYYHKALTAAAEGAKGNHSPHSQSRPKIYNIYYTHTHTYAHIYSVIEYKAKLFDFLHMKP